MSDIAFLTPRIEAMKWMETLSSHLARYKFNFSNEKELQAGMKKAFAKLEDEFLPEHQLSGDDIIDFYWPKQKIGVEVKIDHPLSHLTRQLHRYCQHDSIHGVMLVTSKLRLADVPREMNKKPIVCHIILGSLL